MRRFEVNGEIYNIRFNHYKYCWEIVRVSTNTLIASCDSNELNETLRELESGELS